MGFDQIPAEYPDLGQHLLVHKTLAHGAIPIQVAAFAPQTCDDAAGVTPAMVPIRAGSLVAPQGVAQGAVEQRRERFAADEATHPVGPDEIAFQVGHIDGGSGWRIEVSSHLVDEQRLGVGLQRQPSPPAQCRAGQASRPDPLCFVRDGGLLRQAPCQGSRDVMRPEWLGFSFSFLDGFYSKPEFMRLFLPKT